MRMVGCTEMFAEFPLQPAIARAAVPPGYEIRIHPNGMALLLLMVQECKFCILDGVVHVSPMRMSHIWIELVGPEEIGPPLPGTTASLPTHYYYALPHQIDNPLARLLLSLAGLDVQKVRCISLGGPPGGVRIGNVIERGSQLAKYTWEETSTIWPSPHILTGRRRFYREYGHTLKRRSEGLVVCKSVFLGDGKVILEAHHSSALGQLGVRTPLQGATNPVEMEYCSVHIRVAANSDRIG